MKLVAHLLSGFHVWPKWYLAFGLVCLAALAGTLVLLMRPAAPQTLRVAYDEFYPYVGLDGAGGPTGLAVQVVREAAARAGIPLVWVRVTDAEAALRSGQADLFPLLTVTPERRRDWYFSVPWWESSQALLSPGDKPIQDLPSAIGKRLAIWDLNPAAALAVQRLSGTLLVRVRHSRSIVSEVCSGRVDGAMLDGRLMYEGLLRQPSDCAGRPLQLVPLPETTLPMATASTRAARKTADRLYAAIEQLALDGKLTQLTNRWFVMPQQHYVEAELAHRQRARLLAFSGAGALLLVGIFLWHSRRTLEMRRAAMAAWMQAKQAEERFEAFMSNTPVLHFISDAQGRILYVNRAFTEHLGMTADECYGKTNAQLWPAEVAAAMGQGDQEILSAGAPLQSVISIPGADSTCHLLVLKFRLRDEAGHSCVGGTAINITEQQRVSELVKLSEERYRKLFEEAPVAMHEIDGAGRVRRVNRAECALLGYRPEQMMDKDASYFAAPGERETSVASVNAKLKGLKKLTTFERQYQCADGRIIAAEVHETPIVDKAGAIQGIRTCLIDLTERYQTRERLDRYANELQEKNAALAQALRAAQEATRLKSQFLANMSHEIRTPLNGVLGMTELLLGSGLGPEQCELAACVLQSGEHLLSVINDILDVSKIEAGKFELEKASFDLPAVVESAMELMAPAAYAKNVELSCWIAPEIPESLLGDGSRLRQVLLNLVGNAVKFTKEGEVSVRVMCERVGGPEVTIHVTVADTGIGIPGDARSRLFSAFTQADSSTTRKYGGTGLGLTIAQRIVNLMGGAIGLDSVEGQGSTFWFTCKFGKGVSSVPKPYDASLAGVKVLIADDNATSRSALESYARHWGMLPELVGSGAEALERMRQRACL